MERPTYTREQLQKLPAVVAKRQLDNLIKQTVSYIEGNIIAEAKKSCTKWVWHNQYPQTIQPGDVMDEIVSQLRVTFKDDIDITYKDGNMTIDWST